MSYLSHLRSNLSALFAGFVSATGYAQTTASRVITNDPKFFQSMQTRDFRVGTYDQAAARFSALWPEGLAWPEGIERPEPAEIDRETLDLIKAKYSVHPDWPAGEKWPDDIPQPADRIVIPAVAEMEKLHG